ncbi:MAG: dioxygenase [Bacteroidales bacterium]|nr:dioxygenase [Bacteroidales bacterium]
MANIVYFSHGGGPLPTLGDPSHNEMISFMKMLPNQLEKPDAIIVISAHWEEEVPSVIENNNPSLFYDYYGFPKEAYEIIYPLPDNTELTNQIKQVFDKKNMPIQIDTNRGLDHGVFIPLLMMYPEADIPVTQISLIKGLDPEQHLSLGKALKQFRDSKILIFGSGFSFHNMRAFDWSGKNITDEKNNEFQDWLIDICTGKYSQKEREDHLQNWVKAPYARYCHPREEHLIPLLVCCGASEEKGELIFDNFILGKRAIAIRW